MGKHQDSNPATLVASKMCKGQVESLSRRVFSLKFMEQIQKHGRHIDLAKQKFPNQH